MTTIRKKLSDDYARKAAPETKNWDTSVKGFHLACGKTAKTWYLLNHTTGSVTGKHYVVEDLDALRELMQPLIATFKRLDLI